MKKTSFEAQLIAAAPSNNAVDRHFTDKVMQKIHLMQMAAESVDSTDASRQPLFAKLRHLPRFAIVVLAIALLTLLGGSAYALYKTLWEQPNVTTGMPTTNQLGRKQFTASLEHCGDQNLEATFEVKAGNTLDPAEISKILQARCELEVIRNWSGENNPQPGASQKPTAGISQSSMVMVYPTAGKVASINGTSLSLTGDQHLPTEPLPLNKETQYVVGNSPATQDQIHTGDSVLFVENIALKQTTTETKPGQYNTTGIPTAHTITYVIKLDLPFEYYNSAKQNQVAERQACSGNPQDSCVQTQLVDLYSPSGMTKPGSGTAHIVQGIITELNGKTMKMQSSSGRVFTLTTPSDIVTDFNQHKSSLYDNTKVAVGDLLQVSYLANKNSSDLELDSSRIISIQLALSVVQKNDSVQKY